MPEERIEFALRNGVMLCDYLRKWPHVEFESAVARKIEYMNKVTLAPRMSAALFTKGAIAVLDREKSTGKRILLKCIIH